ncbi:MAG: alpha/beta hydrolase [Maribacter sp.]|uniref:alpha/beta fold hydrolase n=1 Tax=Maribacter sp. TaxID=1897614 RepID=UPI0032986EBC
MRWKYVKWAIVITVVVLLLVPCYRYFGSIDWSRKHSTRIAALPLLQAKDDTGEFRLPAGDFEYFARVAGLQNQGPAVILLHGFPESSIMWADLLKEAAKEGYRVVAFDQRGYSPGARPKGKEHYQIDVLTNDVIAVADQLGFDSFHLVGHDWGAVVAWNTAIEYNERLRSLTTLSIPHLGVFFDAVLNDSEQQQRSGYIKKLQNPFLPEYKFVANRQQFFKQMMRNSPKDQLKEYIALQSELGATTATLNWYRALDINKIVGEKTYIKTINSPTLFIWGSEDMVIAPAIIPEQKTWIAASYKEVVLPTGHGLIQSQTDTVIGAILTHFKEN